MINCIIIHGCPSSKEKSLALESSESDNHWIPWVEKELLDNGMHTQCPEMPQPWEPDYNRFKSEFEKYSVTEDTVLVGHSCGCAFLVRWLGESKQKIKKLILVAPWKINTRSDPIREEFYGFEIDKTINERVDEIIFFTSNTENVNGKYSLKEYQKVLDGWIIDLPEHGHYTFGDMGTIKFPELVDMILA